MAKRLMFYVGTIIWVLSLFIIVSDRNVTEVIPVLESLVVRLIVVLTLGYLSGRLVRPLFRRSSGT